MYKPTPHFIVAGIGAAIIFGALFLTGCGSDARAQVTNDVLSWQRPTQYADGTALPATEILQYRVLSSKVAGGPYTAVESNIAPTLLTWTRASRPAGRQCYVMRTVATSGEVSANSNEACTTKCATGTVVNAAGDCVAAPKPNPPSNVAGN